MTRTKQAYLPCLLSCALILSSLARAAEPPDTPPQTPAPPQHNILSRTGALFPLYAGAFSGAGALLPSTGHRSRIFWEIRILPRSHSDTADKR